MGNKNWVIWAGAACCMLLVLGAMGIVTQRFLDEKNQDVKLGADAYRGERMRLAMWRLDTLATSIVGSEDARPAEALYTQDFKEIIQNQTAQQRAVPEIYENPPAHSNLYWSVNLDKGETRAQSPQVFDDEYLLSNRVNARVNDANKEQLAALNGLLGKKSHTVIPDKGVVSNLDAACFSSHIQQFPESEEIKQKGSKEAESADYSLSALNQQVQEKGNYYEALKYKNEPKVQTEISKKSRSKRRQAVERLTDNYTQSTNWAAKNLQVEPQQIQPQSSVKTEAALVTSFTPIWLNEELVLVRRVKVAGIEKMQGVWLNRHEVTKQLLAEVSDLFPNASLLPLRGDSAADSVENAMLKLPFILVPEEQENYRTLEVGALFDGPIGLAWFGVVLALIAGFFMLRAVLKMSERRAAFVSSVTHELRTPLTTFRLYSDMLSSGLVKDESARQSYLDTLRLESERLTHLVENVLSYSQIERGSARAKVETVSLNTLVSRFESRLRSRAEEDGMSLEVEMADVDPSIELSVDTTAVEQIMFNLVDNASKYASDTDCGKQIILHAEIKKGDLLLSVCDEGRGISKGERKHLFKAFHKTAEQAAATKPGVGLGLALCRRLSRAMGGDLYYQSKPKGACFTLKIPNVK